MLRAVLHLHRKIIESHHTPLKDIVAISITFLSILKSAKIGKCSIHSMLVITNTVSNFVCVCAHKTKDDVGDAQPNCSSTYSLVTTFQRCGRSSQLQSTVRRNLDGVVLYAVQYGRSEEIKILIVF